MSVEVALAAIVLLRETDACAIKDAFKNNPHCIDAVEEFLGKEACAGFVKKLKQSVLLTLPNTLNSAIFFGTLATMELKRLIDDPAIKCNHTAQDHVHSLCFIIDSLDCAQS
ncbi:MAG: hypothetical protein AAB824_02560 [Patescibacteria group bacterium]